MTEDEKMTSPLNTFQSDDLLEKLKLLNYEKNLLAEYKMRPLSRYYFVTATNPGEQFYMFTLLTWWLFQKLGKNMEKPHESNDPHGVISNIMRLLEEMDVGVDFPAHNLITGAGPNCLYVLDTLAGQAVKVMKLLCRKPHIIQEEELNNDYLQDNAEIILEKIENEPNGFISDDDSSSEINFNDKNPFSNRHNRKTPVKMFHQESSERMKQESLDDLLDEQSWRCEFEEISPKLKVYIKSDVRDWRSHLSQMETFKTQMNKTISDAKVELKKLHNEFTFNLEKLESREKHLNNELQPLIGEYKNVSIELSNIKNSYTTILDESEHSTEQLRDVMDENNMKRTEMERRSQTMSDSSLVLQVKRAIAKLKEDIAHLNLEIALLINGIDRDIIYKVENYKENDKIV